MIRHRLVARALLRAAGLLSVPLLAAGAGAVGGGTVDFEAARQRQQQGTEATLASMPLLGQRRIDDVVQLRMEGGVLLLRTPLATTEGHGYVRARVAEVDDTLLVRVDRGGGGPVPATAEPVVPHEVLLEIIDCARPFRVVNLQVSQSDATDFSLVERDATPTESRTVSFVWQRNPLMPGGGWAQLEVSDTGTLETLPTSLVLKAPDCATLFREHPAAVEKHLRPILARLSLESVFAPDPIRAAQVFPETVTPDPKFRAAVDQLLPALGAADYRARDAATAALQSLGAPGAAAVRGVDRGRLSPEQNTRLDQVLAAAGPVVSPSDAVRLRADPAFLLDCLYADDAAVRRAAQAQLERITSHPVALGPAAGPGARSAVVRELRKKITASHHPPAAPPP